MENAKSLVLTLLVLLSLVQSYLLSYSSPKFDPINQSDYVQAELFGTKIELSSLIFPEQIIIHTGNSSHHVLYPESAYYEDILDNIKQTTFDGFRRVNLQFSKMDWEEIRDKNAGVEIRFKDGLPFDVLQTILQIKIDNAYEQDLISKIWIFINENQQGLKTYFVTKSGTELFEAAKTNMTVNDVERFVFRGRFLPAFYVSGGDYYLPDLPLKISQVQFDYRQYTAEELKKSLFVDPGITRNITEWDGSEIYTDGKRGLQIKNDLHWMTYSDPVAPMGNRSNYKGDLSSSVLFINQHGGWDSTYAVDQVPHDTANAENEQTFIFRQYYHSYPIMNEKDIYYGYMKVSLQRGILSNYERSIIVPDSSSITESDRWLLAGEELDRRLNLLSGSSVVSVYPVYRPEVADESVTLVPAWAVQREDGTIIFIDSVITKPEVKEKVEEKSSDEEDPEHQDEQDAEIQPNNGTQDEGDTAHTAATTKEHKADKETTEKASSSGQDSKD